MGNRSIIDNMGKKIKAQVVDGRPIIFDFNVDGQVLSYEMACSKCQNRTFVISIDKSRIACTNTDCHAVMCVRLADTEVDMSEVTWKLN